MLKDRNRFILLIIVLVGFSLRLVGLSNNPTGFTPDEASFGYDAYSILKTGKDQWGKSFPIVLESFGDFKPPLYAYLTIPSVAIFGLNEFSTRLPNAILGTSAIIWTFLLVSELLKNRKKSKEIAVFCAFLISVSSWHIMMSRGAFEANLTTALLPLAIYMFLIAKKRPVFYIFSAFFFGINLFSYHSARVVTPIIFALCLLIFRDRYLGVKNRYKIFFVPIFVAFVCLMIYSFKLGGAARAEDISVLSGAREEASVGRFNMIQKGYSPLLAKVFHNRYRVAGERFVKNYGQYFSYSFLFKNGPREATYGMIPGAGVLYHLDAVALLSFLILVLHKVKKEKEIVFLLLWLLIAPVPAALAQGAGYSANRAVGMLPVLVILAGVGSYYIYEKMKTQGLSRIFYVIVALYLVQTLNFSKIYFGERNRLRYEQMLYGRSEMVQSLLAREDEYEKILVSRSLSEPHIYIAFYSSWDPSDYQYHTLAWSKYRTNYKFLDQYPAYDLGKYTFTSINENTLKSDMLVVGKPGEFDSKLDSEFSVNFPNGSSAIEAKKASEILQ